MKGIQAFINPSTYTLIPNITKSNGVYCCGEILGVAVPRRSGPGLPAAEPVWPGPELHRGAPGWHTRPPGHPFGATSWPLLLITTSHHLPSCHPHAMTTMWPMSGIQPNHPPGLRFEFLFERPPSSHGC